MWLDTYAIQEPAAALWQWWW